MFGNNGDDELFSTTALLAPNEEASEKLSNQSSSPFYDRLASHGKGAGYTTDSADLKPRYTFQELAIMNKNSIVSKLVNFRTDHSGRIISLYLLLQNKHAILSSICVLALQAEPSEKRKTNSTWTFTISFKILYLRTSLVISTPENYEKGKVKGITLFSIAGKIVVSIPYHANPAVHISRKCHFLKAKCNKSRLAKAHRVSEGFIKES
ncbi:hypothetical protein WUBG_08524 [Wuchereria bancrofti]|uniref:Uncharacterized protein n=1 Tax=Wuchereria bancrofti TaxID=6293 RepID=J9ETX6_WUCBA|nr:hypothetical protein WUBG_08524 [Wuchereria bancrofti]